MFYLFTHSARTNKFNIDYLSNFRNDLSLNLQVSLVLAESSIQNLFDTYLRVHHMKDLNILFNRISKQVRFSSYAPRKLFSFLTI